MIKVEMAKTKSESGGLQTNEHIWLSGQSWPVLEADDARIVRLEAFGTELGECLQFASATGKPVPDSAGVEVCRTWYMEDARNVSRMMRQRHP